MIPSAGSPGRLLVSSPPMSESLRGFLRFLRSVDLRVFQEREIGLDVYLSGFWAIAPLVLAVA